MAMSSILFVDEDPGSLFSFRCRHLLNRLLLKLHRSEQPMAMPVPAMRIAIGTMISDAMIGVESSGEVIRGISSRREYSVKCSKDKNDDTGDD